MCSTDTSSSCKICTAVLTLLSERQVRISWIIKLLKWVVQFCLLIVSEGKQLRKSAVREKEETAGSYSAVMLVSEQGPPCPAQQLMCQCPRQVPGKSRRLGKALRIRPLP